MQLRRLSWFVILMSRLSMLPAHPSRITSQITWGVLGSQRRFAAPSRVLYFSFTELQPLELFQNQRALAIEDVRRKVGPFPRPIFGPRI